MNQTEDEENEDVRLSPELERIVSQEDQEMGLIKKRQNW